MAIELLDMQDADERLDRTRVAVGKRSEDPEIAAMQRLLQYMYASWVLDAPLFVSA